MTLKGLREEVKNLPTVTQIRDRFQPKMVLGGSERLEVSAELKLGFGEEG